MDVLVFAQWLIEEYSIWVALLFVGGVQLVLHLNSRREIVDSESRMEEARTEQDVEAQKMLNQVADNLLQKQDRLEAQVEHLREQNTTQRVEAARQGGVNEASIKLLREQVNDLRGELKKAQNQMIAAKLRSRDNSDLLTQANAQVGELQEKVIALQQLLEHEKSKRLAAEAALEPLTEQIDTLRKTQAVLTKRLDKARAELEEAIAKRNQIAALDGVEGQPIDNEEMRDGIRGTDTDGAVRADYAGTGAGGENLHGQEDQSGGGDDQGDVPGDGERTAGGGAERAAERGT